MPEPIHMTLAEFERDGLRTLLAPFVRPMGVSAPVCAHEDVQLECPFCERVVDPDTLVCLTCKEMVAAVRVCIYCGEPTKEVV